MLKEITMFYVKVNLLSQVHGGGSDPQPPMDTPLGTCMCVDCYNNQLLYIV